ncbi:MAG: Ku protein [Acidobacteria bacterium]|nr:Ku protein [Acidobacteriota bacterium]
MRPIWSGSITFGLVSVPVELHSALNSNDVSFNLLHKECNSRIKQQTYCPVHDRTVERSELVKGYEYAKDRYVIMEESDFEKLEVAASRNIEVLAFVALDEVDPIYFNRPYFLMPEGDSQKTFALLFQGMKKAGKAALVRFVMRGKEYAGCIAPREKSMLLYILYHRDEVKDRKEFAFDYKGSVREKEVTLAQQIIDNLSEPFHPEMLKDNYREKLLDILQQKAQGQAVTPAPAKRPPAKVINLMDALKKSVLETSKIRKKPAARAVGTDRGKKRKKA